LPKLVVKFARIPAMFGGLAIGAFAWVQYQATRTSGFLSFNRLLEPHDLMLTMLYRSR
jgi:hypothetical protein